MKSADSIEKNEVATWVDKKGPETGPLNYLLRAVFLRRAVVFFLAGALRFATVFFLAGAAFLRVTFFLGAAFFFAVALRFVAFFPLRPSAIDSLRKVFASFANLMVLVRAL